MLVDLAALAGECTTNARRWFPHIYAGPRDDSLMFDALELGGEAGELLNVIKKLRRDGTTPDLLDAAKLECADVLICALRIARDLDADPFTLITAKNAINSSRWG